MGTILAGFYCSSLCAAHKSLLLRTMRSFCPRGGCRMRCDELLSGSWGSMVKASRGVPEMCSSLQPAGPALQLRLCPVSGDSSKHIRDTQTLPCVPQAREATVLHPPLGLPALQQPQLCSALKNKTWAHLSTALGFQKHKGYPKGISRDP